MTLLRPALYRSGNLDSWLQDLLQGDEPFRAFWGEEPRYQGFRRPSNVAVDYYEGKDSFFAVFELPGVNKSDVQLELENSVLSIRGKHTDKRGEEESVFEFSRSLALPEGVDVTKVSAEMKDGLLTVTFPKREESKPRAIEIN